MQQNLFCNADGNKMVWFNPFAIYLNLVPADFGNPSGSVQVIFIKRLHLKKITNA
jgi:hypothetical protein